MGKIYFINAHGKRVSIEVSEEIEKQYRESLREEWRGDAYEKYYTKSLDGIIEAGRDFEDGQADTEELYVLKEERKEQANLIDKLKAALPLLTELQRQTIHKLFDLNMSQSEIAREGWQIQQFMERRNFVQSAGKFRSIRFSKTACEQEQHRGKRTNALDCKVA